MKKILSIIAIVCILGLSAGCSTTGMQAIHEVGAEIDFYGQVNQFMDDWPAISGAIDRLFDGAYADMAFVAVNAKQHLDKLSAKKEKNPDYVFTNRELGEAWGDSEKLLQTAIKESLRLFYPQAFNLIPAGLF